MTKIKNEEHAKLQQELEAIEKNNAMLKLIELQYQREIDRRLKQEERVKLEEELGEKILDSPLRRAREYALNIAGSPSPVKRIVRKGTYQFEISPDKTAINLQPAPMPKDGEKSMKTFTSKATSNDKSKSFSAAVADHLQNKANSKTTPASGAATTTAKTIATTNATTLPSQQSRSKDKSATIGSQQMQHNRQFSK